MTIIFLSNYYNHHQAPFSEEMNRLLNGNYHFIATEKVSEERAQMGWMTDGYPSFVHQYDEEKELCDELVNTADVVITGSAPYKLIKQRLKEHKLTFIYSERWDKKKANLLRRCKQILSTNYYYGFKKNLYCLCASAFTSYDISRRLCLKKKFYKWGYFPKVTHYDDIEKIIRWKQTVDVSILFVSRLIGWKHPELPVQVAKRLKDDGVKFHLTMIGIGDMEDKVHCMIDEYGLQNVITHLKSMSPDEVRTDMEKALIFIFTSDRNEGWGAVLNESMNSGCAVVASSEIGSVPYLIEDGKNGYIYEDGNFDDLYSKVKELCLNQKKREQFGTEAYKTMLNMWNAENAAERLLELIKDLQKIGKSDRFTEGPCSKADIFKDGWYKKFAKK